MNGNDEIRRMGEHLHAEAPINQAAIGREPTPWELLVRIRTQILGLVHQVDALINKTRAKELREEGMQKLREADLIDHGPQGFVEGPR